MKILFITNIPTPYTLDFLREFDKLTDLNIVFERSNSKERDKSWKNLNYSKLNVKILRGIPYKTDMAFAPQIIFKLKRNYDYTIVSNPLTPTGLFAILWIKIRRLKYILISEGGFTRSQKNLKEWLKRIIISNASLCLSGSPLAIDFYKYYGAELSKVKSYPFSSLNQGDILKKIPTQLEKENIKKSLNIRDQKIIVSVGRIIYQKGFDVLLKLANGLSNTSIYIIGGHPSKELADLSQGLSLKNVHFINFLDKDNLNKYYLMADLFVLPTRKDEYGLVINEAMAKGLPIISTNMSGAALELIENNQNGFIVSVDDLNEFAEKINLILENQSLKNKLAENSLNKIGFYTVENMAKVVYNHLLAILR